MLCLVAQPLHAQESAPASTGTAQTTGDREPSFSPRGLPLRAGYQNDDAMGGPESIGVQLMRDDQDQGYRIPIRVFKGWYDNKARVYDDTGIQFNLNYTTTTLWSGEQAANGDDFAAGGWATGILSWKALETDSGAVGRLNVNVQSRHKFTDIAPMFLGFQTGTNSLTATGYKEFSPRFAELNWSQSLLDNRVHLTIGKVDMPNYFTFHGLLVPFTDFLSYGFSVNSTVNWPDQGAGLVGSVRPTENLYIMAGVSDSQGDRFDRGDILCCGDNFFDGRVFTAVEVGFVPSFAERLLKKISLTYWHNDEYAINGDPASISPEGEGWAFTAHWYFNDRIMPFIKYGKNDGEQGGQGFNTISEEAFTVGTGFKLFGHDVLGVGLDWSKPAFDPGLPTQTIAEIYYRMMLTEHLAISPDFQYVWNPALNQDLASTYYFQLRIRLTF